MLADRANFPPESSQSFSYLYMANVAGAVVERLSRSDQYLLSFIALSRLALLYNGLIGSRLIVSGEEVPKP